MTYVYCVICQARLGSDKKKYHQLNNPEMIQRIVAIKPTLLKKWNKTDNCCIIEVGNFVHKKCQVNADYYYNKNPVLEIFNDNFIDCVIEHEIDTRVDCLSENESQINQYTQQTNSNISTSQILTAEKVSVNIQKVRSSHKKCFVCGEESTYNKLATIKSETVYDALLKSDIYIVKGSRCCISHLDEKGFLTEDSILRIKPIYGSVLFDEDSIKELISNFQNTSNCNQFFSQFDSSKPLEEKTFKLIGFSKHEFFYLCSYLNHMKDSNQRTKEQALFVYLFWLRNGISLEVNLF